MKTRIWGLAGMLSLGTWLGACGGPAETGATTNTSTGGSGGASTAGSGTGGDSGGTSSGGTNAWETLAPLAGGPRQECAVVALDGKVHVIGGFDKTLEVVADVEVYDPETDGWSTAASLPGPLHHANAAVVGGKIYVLGFLEGLGFAVSGGGFVYDPSNDTWSPVASLPAGRERGAAAVGVIGDHVYIAGGFRGDSVADVDRYDTTTDTWESLPDLPEARDHLVGAAVDGVFFAIGGRNGGIAELRAQVDILDPQQGTWESGTPMLTARGGAAVGVLDGRIHVVGGEGNPDDPAGVFAENEAYDPAADTWSTHAPMSPAKHGTGGAVVGGKLYVPGGAIKQAFGATDDVQVFVP